MDALTAAEGLNFELPEEIRMLKDTVRKFVDRELIPIERTARENNKLKPEVRAHLTAKANELGLAGYDVPQQYGGLGMGLIAKVTVWAELGRTIALPSRGIEVFGPNVSPILYHLNEAQKKKYLLPTIRGELNWCLAQTEPDAGGDPGGMRTTAVRQGDHYVINGTKRFITGADEAHFTQLIAATDRSKGSHGGISAFIVDMKAPGVQAVARPGARGRRPAMGDRLRRRQGTGREPHRRGRRRLQPRAALAQRRPDPARRAQHRRDRALPRARLAIRQAARDVRQAARGPPGGAMDAGRKLHGAAPARLMVYDAAWKYDQGRDIRAEAYMAKIFGDTQSFHAADRCMEIHGGMGLATDLPIEKFWRDQRSMMITEGPIEILRWRWRGTCCAPTADSTYNRRKSETGGRPPWLNTNTNAPRCESTTASPG